MTPPRTGPARPGFTLVELVVASIIVAGIASAITVATSQSLRAKTASVARQQAMQRAHGGAARVALDLRNALRDADLYYARVAVADIERSGRPADELLLFAAAGETAGLGGGGAPEHEVQYRAASVRLSDGTDRAALWRRVDAVPDDTPDGGGVVFPVIEGVESVSIEAFDGSAWRAEWDSDRDGYPYAVRVTVSAVSDNGRVRETARRVVPFDRVPPPITPTRPADDDDDGEGGS